MVIEILLVFLQTYFLFLPELIGFDASIIICKAMKIFLENSIAKISIRIFCMLLLKPIGEKKNLFFMHHFCQSVITYTRKMMNGLIAFSPSEI